MKEKIVTIKNAVVDRLRLLGFIVRRKKWELVPIVIILIIFGLVLLAAESPIIAPLIYTVF